MRRWLSARCTCGLIAASGLLALSACQTHEPEPVVAGAGQAATPAAAPEPAKPVLNEIPPAELPAVMAAHFKGVGFMEQYKYGEAAQAFREVRRRAPGWVPGSINLAIALLNDSGVKAEQAKKAGGEAAPSNFDEALELLAGVLEREPENLYAHFCRGIILEQQGHLAEAHKHFKKVTEIDPDDAAGWYWTGSTLPDLENPSQPAGPKQAAEQIAFFVKALERNPYMTPALYKMAMSSRFTREPERTKSLFEKWKKMNPDRPDPSPGPGDSAAKEYGEMGKYASVINPFPRFSEAPKSAAIPLKFADVQSLRVALAAGQRWVKSSDFDGARATIGRARARFGAAVTVFDADGDGQLDLFLPSALVGPKGLHDALLLNKGEGRFEDVSASFGLAQDRASLGAAAADFDADRHIDLYLTGVGANVLLRNRDGKSFEDITSLTKPVGPAAVSLMARWLDLDQDGDLDLYVVNYCPAEHADKAFLGTDLSPPGIANLVYRNDGQPDPGSGSNPQNRTPVATAYGTPLVNKGLSLALSPWTDTSSLSGGPKAHTGVALLDLDSDRDLDLILTAEKSAPVAILNDRLGQFHVAAIEGVSPSDQLSGILATDFDADGRTDLVAACWNGRALAWRNITVRGTADTTTPRFEPWPLSAVDWRSAQAIDLDLDGSPDLLGLPASGSKASPVLPAWARNEQTRFTTQSLPLDLSTPGLVGVSAVDLIGDPLPDILVLPEGEAPAVARNVGNGQNWLALQLGGHWRVKPELMRTNSHAIGTRVLIEGQGLHVNYDHTTTETGLGQSIAPVVLGLGRHDQAALVHLRWPDGVMQCELNVAANQKVELAENNRKTGSCPVLFTWNGKRFVCIGDFLGGGGLGYLVAPGVYSQPDRDEAMAVSAQQLVPSQGVFRLSVTEPMDEVAYIDHLQLDVVDSPPGVMTALDERFAPEGPRPSGDLVAWRTTIEPVGATDLAGVDVADILRHDDRRTVDTFTKRDGWIGYALEHGIIVDFGEKLSRFGPSDPLVLGLAGWVEYPYSQTNYAAATAGVTLRPPTIERQRTDGTWEMIEPHAGYPAGLPRLMTVDLTGKLSGPSCKIRIKTNMECYYDRIFVAATERSALGSLRVSKLPVKRARLGYRGYTREISPDGLLPLVYDYDYVDPAPLASFRGKLTRQGDVTDLLTTDDDRLCLVGPGEEVQIEFPADGLPALAAGWTRSYVVRGIGYCKDADPFTATSDRVEPLPWRGMPPFPFGPDVKRPATPEYDAYLRTYQIRTAGAGG
jgi:tetratricopeptide (TPR) repeat protein